MVDIKAFPYLGFVRFDLTNKEFDRQFNIYFDDHIQELANKPGYSTSWRTKELRSVDYFGTRGDVPTNPELLDHLATRFMQGGWSQKAFLRALVLSRTYRLSSANDAAAMKRAETLEEILEEVCSYLEGKADMIADQDGDAPNAELFLLSWIRSELER